MKGDVYSLTFGLFSFFSIMHNYDVIDLTTEESEKPEILTFYYLTKNADDEMTPTYSTAKKKHMT